MKQQKILLLGITILLMLVSCSKEEFLGNKPDGYSIPREEALSNMFALMEEINTSTRASLSHDIISKVSVISSRDLMFQTRSTDSPSMDSLLYIVNFENESGYAVLSADRRIKDEVLIISESGHLNPNLLPMAAGLSSFGASDTLSAGNDSLFIPGIIVSYLRNSGPDDGDSDCPGDEGEGGGGTSGDWNTYERVDPMIPYLWHQHSPFNDMIPVNNQGEHKLAGCVPVALGSILAYWEFPAHYSYQGHEMNWSEMKTVGLFQNDMICSGSYVGRVDVAYLMSSIGVFIDATYTSGWTLAWPSNAREFMEMLGYSEADLHLGYDNSAVVNMLLDDKPVFIAAVSDLINGHAWVVDGMLRQRKNGNTRDILHCKFGWLNGNSNGYYVSGLFDTSQGPVSYDRTFENGPSHSQYDFDWGYRIITY